MSSVSERVRQHGLTTVIDLTEGELQHYSGAGWRLAAFRGGTLVCLHNPGETEWQGSTQATADAALNEALAVLQACRKAGQECWLVMCSSSQLCDVQALAVTDASSMARLARVIGDDLANG